MGSSHEHHEDSSITKKRELKTGDKEKQHAAHMLASLAPTSAFAPKIGPSTATGSFKPNNSTELCLEGIRRLRGCSTSLESNNIHNDKKNPLRENLLGGAQED